MAKKKGTGDPVITNYKVVTPINLGEGKSLDVGETFEADANDADVAELVEVGALVAA